MWTQEWSDIPSRSDCTWAMCHQARTSGSALSALEQRLEPAVAARRRANPGRGDRLARAAPSSPGPAASTSTSTGAVSSGSGMAPSAHLDSVRSASIRAPLTASHGHAHARAALLGNPSDGFGGRTLALTMSRWARG